MRFPVRAAVLLFALGILAACGAPHAVAPPVPPPPTGAACLDALGARSASFALTAVPAARRGCAVADSLALHSTRSAIEPVAILSCPLALRLAEFDERVIQPAALRHFGRPVARVRQIGAYSCRMRTGGGRLSEHASGRAIDIAAFEIEGGPHVAVKSHWRDPGPRGAFLRAVAREACGWFSVVLTPNHDVWHADHLHFDLGRYRLCGL